ncbi:MAG: response regulator [Desulfomonilaceae bacterium]
MDQIKVMIVDDHPIVREGLRQLLEFERDIEIVGEASSGLDCLSLMDRVCPDIIFLDVRMPGISGIETARIICEKHPSVKIIMLTIYTDDRYVQEAILAGAKGYLLKSVTRKELVQIIHHVIEGGAFLHASVTATVLDQIRRPKGDLDPKEKTVLTRRELEVLHGLVLGLKDREIGEMLYISEFTVRAHIKSIYRKLNVSSRAKAVIMAREQGIIGD